MDRGRQIDHTQNCDAQYYDKYGQGGHTSVKIANPPGGKSNFSLGWGGDPEPEQQPHYGRKRFDNFSNQPEQPQPQPQGRRRFGNQNCNQDSEPQQPRGRGRFGNQNYNQDSEPQQSNQPVRGRRRFGNMDQNKDNFNPPNRGQNNSNNNQQYNPGQAHTSVRVSNNPGGQSHIVFGDDKTSYEEYRK